MIENNVVQVLASNSHNAKASQDGPDAKDKIQHVAGELAIMPEGIRRHTRRDGDGQVIHAVRDKHDRRSNGVAATLAKGGGDHKTPYKGEKGQDQDEPKPHPGENEETGV